MTTCIAYPRPAVDDEELVERARRHRGQPVLRHAGPPRRDARRSQLEPVDHHGRRRACSVRPTGCSRRSSRGTSSPRPNAQSIGGSDVRTCPPYPGQLEQAAFALISRGAAMIEYWHWHTLPYGTETYWGGVLPHSLVPGRVYARGRRSSAPSSAAIGDDARRLRARRRRRDPVVEPESLRPAVHAAVPPSTAQPDRASYERIVDAFHRGVDRRRARRRASCTSTRRTRIGAAALAARFPVLVAAGAVRRDRRRPRRSCATTPRHGGHLVRRRPHGLRRRGGAGAHRGRARRGCSEAAGVRYDEYSNLDDERRRSPRPARSTASDGRGATSGSTGSSPTAPTCSPATSTRGSATSRRSRRNAHRRRAHHRRRHGALARAGRRHRRAGRVPTPVADGARRRGQPCPSPSRPARCPTGDAPGSSSTGDGSRRQVTLALPSPTRSTGDRLETGTDVSLAGLVDADLRQSVSTTGSCDPTQPQKEQS